LGDAPQPSPGTEEKRRRIISKEKREIQLKGGAREGGFLLRKTKKKGEKNIREGTPPRGKAGEGAVRTVSGEGMSLGMHASEIGTRNAGRGENRNISRRREYARQKTMQVRRAFGILNERDRSSNAHLRRRKESVLVRNTGTRPRKVNHCTTGWGERWKKEDEIPWGQQNRPFRERD